METQVGRWALGLVYIFAVATIWIAASFVVQSVVDGGVSPFLITYICNSLFIIYIPIAEIRRYVEDKYGTLQFWKTRMGKELGESEEIILLEQNKINDQSDGLNQIVVSEVGKSRHGKGSSFSEKPEVGEDSDMELDSKGRWTRIRVAKVSLMICPIWFLAQLAFNISLKYTTVTSNTILSSSSSLFTFLVSLMFLGELFTWVKLLSVLLCMGGTIIVSLSDSKSMSNQVATNPALGDALALASAAFYAVYITLIKKKLPDDDGKNGQVSVAHFLGFLGLFNLLIFLPVALILHFTNLEPFSMLTAKQVGLIVGKGMLDNVLSDYLWAKAVLLTSTTVATAGLTIQVPLAAIVDSLTGNTPNLMDYVGAAAVMVGFAGINIPSGTCSGSDDSSIELRKENATSTDEGHAPLRCSQSST